MLREEATWRIQWAVCLETFINCHIAATLIILTPAYTEEELDDIAWDEDMDSGEDSDEDSDEDSPEDSGEDLEYMEVQNPPLLIFLYCC